MPTRFRKKTGQTRLEALSLERGWSYARMADEIKALTGQTISAATVHRLAKGDTPSRLTQHKLDAFFDALKPVTQPVTKRA